MSAMLNGRRAIPPRRALWKADLARRAKAGGWCSYADSMHDEVEANRQTIVEVRQGVEREFERTSSPSTSSPRDASRVTRRCCAGTGFRRKGTPPSPISPGVRGCATAALIQVGMALDWAVADGGRVSVNFLGSASCRARRAPPISSTRLPNEARTPTG